MGEDQNLEAYFELLTDALDRFAIRIIQIDTREPLPDPAKSVEIGDDHKAEIRVYLDRIRAVVDQTDWSARKKDAVHEKINDLHEIVERTWTRLEAFMANFLDLSNMLGVGAKEAKPFTDSLEGIIETVAKARAANQQQKLEPPEEQKKLPAPEATEEDAANDD